MDNGTKALLEARKESDELIAVLAGHINKLTDVLAALGQKKSERRLVPYQFAAPNGVRTEIIGGIPGARIGLLSLIIFGGAAAAAFSLDEGRGTNWGPLIGMPGFSTINLPISGEITLSGGDLESPLILADIGNTVSINNTGAQSIVGAGCFVTLETGP